MFSKLCITSASVCSQAGEDLLKLANAIELGRVAARDIGGSDPETMAPQNVWKYVECLFPDTVTVKQLLRKCEIHNTTCV